MRAFWLLSTLLFLGAPSVVRAAEKAPDVAVLERLQRAYELLLQARNEGSPEKLLEVAALLRRVAVEDAGDRMREIETKPPLSEQERLRASGDPGFIPADRDAVLEEASALAGDDLALRERVAKASKARVQKPDPDERPVCATGRVPSHSTQIWRVSFRPESSAAIGVQGDDDTDLDCSVFDPAGGLLSSHTVGRHCLLNWEVASRGDFTIHIKNKSGAVFNNYRICANANPDPGVEKTRAGVSPADRSSRYQRGGRAPSTAVRAASSE